MGDCVAPSPADDAHDAPAIALDPLALTCVWSVRGDPARPALIDAVTRALGVVPVTRPNGSARSDRGWLLTVGPRAWLWLSDVPAAQSAFDDARRTLNDSGGALFDVSSAYVAWRVTGRAARRVINRGCPLDLDPRVFAPGDCAQSLFGHIPMLIHRRDDTTAFVVAVARSYARDAWDLLRASAVTDGYPMDAPTRA